MGEGGITINNDRLVILRVLHPTWGRGGTTVNNNNNTLVTLRALNPTWTKVGSRESQKLINQIKSYLQEFGPSRFPILADYKKNPNDHNQALWGFRKDFGDECHWVVLSEVFRNHLCKGYDYRRALKDLKKSFIIKW